MRQKTRRSPGQSLGERGTCPGSGLQSNRAAGCTQRPDRDSCSRDPRITTTYPGRRVDPRARRAKSCSTVASIIVNPARRYSSAFTPHAAFSHPNCIVTELTGIVTLVCAWLFSRFGHQPVSAMRDKMVGAPAKLPGILAFGRPERSKFPTNGYWNQRPLVSPGRPTAWKASRDPSSLPGNRAGRGAGQGPSRCGKRRGYGSPSRLPGATRPSPCRPGRPLRGVHLRTRWARDSREAALGVRPEDAEPLSVGAGRADRTVDGAVGIIVVIAAKAANKAPGPIRPFWRANRPKSRLRSVSTGAMGTFLPNARRATGLRRRCPPSGAMNRIVRIIAWPIILCIRTLSDRAFPVHPGPLLPLRIGCAMSRRRRITETANPDDRWPLSVCHRMAIFDSSPRIRMTRRYRLDRSRSRGNIGLLQRIGQQCVLCR